MSAAVLREAASLMRERARVGAPDEYPPPWSVSLDDHFHNTYEVLCHEDGSGLVTDDLDRDMAEHIASWHPAVALAVADWLDFEARVHDADEWSGHERSLAVARAYLGESA